MVVDHDASWVRKHEPARKTVLESVTGPRVDDTAVAEDEIVDVLAEQLVDPLTEQLETQVRMVDQRARMRTNNRGRNRGVVDGGGPHDCGRIRLVATEIAE